jgi:hypothetical protein
MEDKKNHEEEGENPLQNNQPWLDKDIVAIPKQVHNLPRHREKLLPKFDPKTSGLSKDHIKKFILVIKLMDVPNEDVVCIIFHYTFENLSSMWYFNLLIRYITIWTKFQTYFLDKISKETTM